MKHQAQCKSLCRRFCNWSTLLKSTLVALVVGASLTWTNYGNVVLQPEKLPVWWKLVLNFVVPFAAELLFCIVFFNCLESLRIKLLTEKQSKDSYKVDTLSEIAVQTKPIHRSKSIHIELHEIERPYQGVSHSRRHESCPAIGYPPSSLEEPDQPGPYFKNHGCVRTQSNGVSIYTVNELIGVDPIEPEDSLTIRPLRNEGTRYLKCKSMGCLADLYGSGAANRSRPKVLQVFDNDLYFRE